MNQLATKILSESKWLTNVSISAYGEAGCRIYGATASFSPCPNKNCIQYAGGADFINPNKAIEKAIFEAFERYSLFNYVDGYRDERKARNSSGTAAHTSIQEAKRLAAAELIERDAIMRFWYYRQPAEWIMESGYDWLKEHNAIFSRSTGHNIIAFVLPSQYAFVVLATIVGEDFPYFVSGAAASFDSLEKAIQKSVLEAEFSFYSYRNGIFKPIRKKKIRTPIDHGLYYAQSKDNASKLHWIYGGCSPYVGNMMNYNFGDALEKIDLQYATLSVRSDIIAIRASSPDLVPITFGYGMDNSNHPALDQKKVKRVQEPHFFA